MVGVSVKSAVELIVQYFLFIFGSKVWIYDS